jgi:hypothetical protein
MPELDVDVKGPELPVRSRSKTLLQSLRLDGSDEELFEGEDGRVVSCDWGGRPRWAGSRFNFFKTSPESQSISLSVTSQRLATRLGLERQHLPPFACVFEMEANQEDSKTHHPAIR